MKSVRSTTKFALIFCVLLSFAACTQSKTTPTATADSTAQAAQKVAPVVPDVSGAPPAFDSERAWQYTKDVVAFGPRPIGSANHKKLEEYILDHLKGDDVVADTFMADTPEGQLPVRNIIARYPGTKDGVIIIAGHYDTVYPLRNSGYVGANDGGLFDRRASRTRQSVAQQEARRLQRVAAVDGRRRSRQRMEDRRGQRLWRPLPRQPVAERWHAQNHQSVFAGGHDRRC